MSNGIFLNNFYLPVGADNLHGLAAFMHSSCTHYALTMLALCLCFAAGMLMVGSCARFYLGTKRHVKEQNGTERHLTAYNCNRGGLMVEANRKQTGSIVKARWKGPALKH